MEIPFNGEVCPFCQRDKSSDKTLEVGGIVGMFIGGTVGSWIGGFGGMIVGALVVGLLIAIIAAASGGHSAKKPPRVRIDSDKAAMPTAPAIQASKPSGIDDPASRLARLDMLKAQGIITEDEYKERRTVIIAAL